MKKTAYLALLLSVLATGCSSLGREVGVYNHNTEYLNTDRYVAKDIVVPGDLSNKNMEEFFHVPTIANQGDPSVPALLPPLAPNSSDTMPKGATA